MKILKVKPNPLFINRLGTNLNRGNVTIKNKGANLILFRISFDTEIFCGISPACGELEPNSSRNLNFFLDDFDPNIKEISFSIKYLVILPNTEPITITQIMSNEQKLKESVTAEIKFVTHAEEAMNSISKTIKSKSTLDKAIEKSKNTNLHEKQIVELQKKIDEKDKEIHHLKSKIKRLKKQNIKQTEEYEQYKASRDKQDNYFFVLILLFLVFLIIKRFFR